MKNSILLGLHRFMLRIPRPVWQREIVLGEQAAEKSISFMTEEHHRVRDYVVREMPRTGKPVSPEVIGRELAMQPEGVILILDELEERLTFLYRNEHGAVTWAYPVTVEITPHHVTFSSGESIYAA